MTDEVTVELISNPAVQRQLTRKGAEILNKNLWRIVGAVEPAPEVKKKVVEPVGKSNPEPVQEPSGLLMALKNEYEQAAGKAPDGRWNIARLTKEIKALKPQEA